MLVVLAAPAINACTGDDRGLLTCVRGLIDDRFEIGLEADAGPTPEAVQPIAIDAPAPVEPAPEMQLAEAIVPIPVMAPTRSLVPPAPEKPIAPPPTPPKVIPAPRVAAIPDLPAIEPEVAAPATDEIDPAPIAVPTVIEAVPVEAAPLVVPLEEPPVEVPLDAPPADPVAAIPDVTTVPTLDPAPARYADPWFAPPAPTALPGAPLPLTTEPVAADPEPVPPESRPAAAPEPAPDEAPLATSPVLEPRSVASIPDLEATPVAPAPVAEPDPAPVEMPPILPPPPPVEPEATVAAIDPVIPDDPEPVARFLAPTIDAIEIDGDGNFIAGDGPAGATMRLYVDGLPVGVSRVEGSRWLVEGTDLLTEEQQVLKVVALDPLSGKVLGEASTVFEGPLPAAAEAPTAGHPVAPVVDPAAQPPDAGEPEAIVDQPVDPAAPEAAVVEPTTVPPLEPVIPKGESASVTILKPSGDTGITVLRTTRTGD